MPADGAHAHFFVCRSKIFLRLDALSADIFDLQSRHNRSIITLSTSLMVVSVEKKTIVLRSKLKSDKEKYREVKTQLIDYGETHVDNVVISVAVAVFELKGEDRHQVMSLTEDETFRESTNSFFLLSRALASYPMYSLRTCHHRNLPNKVTL